jgi:TetR/AcrR family transcriptional regulator, acrAB operon repressor
MMVRRTKEEAAVTRAALLKAALAVFSRQGYASTRLEDIAEEAGVTRGAIYHHFGSKPDLYTEMVVEYSKPLNRIVEDALAISGTTTELLRRIFVDMCAAMEDDAELRAIQEISTTKTEMTPELAEGIYTKMNSIEQQVSYLTEGIAEGIAKGEFRTQIDPEDAARAYFSYLNGYMLLWLLDQSSFSIKARAPQMIDIFLRGLLS